MRLPVTYLGLGSGALDLVPVRARARLQAAEVVLADDAPRLRAWNAAPQEARGLNAAEIVAVLRKAYAAGYYAMACPGFEPVATIALAGAQIGAMAGEAAVNAIWANKLAEIEDPAERAAFIAERSTELDQELDALRLASDLLIDTVVEPEQLRDELRRRLDATADWERQGPGRHHGVFPV